MKKLVKHTKPFAIDWRVRHFVVLLFAVLGVYLFLEMRAQWSDMHRWNRAIGDMSFILIAISMAIGPFSRLVKLPFNLTAWRRELGIYGVLLAIIHTIIILVGWVNWDFLRLFGFELHPSGVYVMFAKGFGLANIIGIIALFYGLVLALTSSNWSQRILSGSVWKFIQQGAYILWWLIIIHTAYFLYIHFLDFHRATPEPNFLQWPFAIIVILVSLLQFAASVNIWRLKRKRIA